MENEILTEQVAENVATSRNRSVLKTLTIGASVSGIIVLIGYGVYKIRKMIKNKKQLKESEKTVKVSEVADDDDVFEHGLDG